jgi:predicted ribosomally synthesized peptide with SipW-like signal peptide
MKGKIFLSFLILILAAFSIGGGVVAWFTSNDTPEANTFSAGTLGISQPVYMASDEDWFSGESKTILYSFQNIGSREAYVRVKPLVDFSGESSSPEPIQWTLEEGSQTLWTQGSDGWWYYGSHAGPEIISALETVNISFIFSTDAGISGTASFYLEAEAIQISANSLTQLWADNPW